MKILVCVSNVPDTTTKITFTDNNTKFNTDGVQWILNPYDEWYALVRALEIKEAAGGSVTVINVGGPENDAVIRKALAIGADDAIRVNAQAAGPYFVASQIANVAKEGSYDIIFTGKETINYNGSNIGGMVAELLDLPFVSYVTKMDLNGNTATAERDIEGGKEVVEVNTRGIMMAKRKPLNVVEPAAVDALREIVNYELPAPKAAVKLIDPENVSELVDLLHNEAKVI